MSTILGTLYNLLVGVKLVLSFIWSHLRYELAHTHVYSNPDLKFDVGSLTCASCIELFITIHTFNEMPEKYGRILFVCCLAQMSFAFGMVIGGELFFILTAIGGVFFIFEEIITYSSRRLLKYFVLNTAQEMKELFLVLGIIGQVMNVSNQFYAKICFVVLFSLSLCTQVYNLLSLGRLSGIGLKELKS